MSGSNVRVPAPELPAGRRSALVIATSMYTDPALRELRAPASDAVEFGRVLADPAIGGFEVRTASDRPSHELQLEITNFLAHRSPDELVLVYVSAHGVVDARGRLYFAATNTSKGTLAATGVESSWLNERLEECRARSQIVILDCCFSGAFARRAKGASPEQAIGVLAGRGRAVLTASRAYEYSFEEPTDVGAAETSPAPGSVFTSALLAGLRDGSADKDADGLITLDEAYDYAFLRVRERRDAQTPQRYLFGGEGQLALARNPRGRRIVPAVIPESFRSALENPRPQIRIGAVKELERWLESNDVAQVVAAQSELLQVTVNDIRSVADVARQALERAGMVHQDDDSSRHGTRPDGVITSSNARRTAAVLRDESSIDRLTMPTAPRESAKSASRSSHPDAAHDAARDTPSRIHVVRSDTDMPAQMELRLESVRTTIHEAIVNWTVPHDQTLRDALRDSRDERFRHNGFDLRQVVRVFHTQHYEEVLGMLARHGESSHFGLRYIEVASAPAPLLNYWAYDLEYFYLEPANSNYSRVQNTLVLHIPSDDSARDAMHSYFDDLWNYSSGHQLAAGREVFWDAAVQLGTQLPRGALSAGEAQALVDRYRNARLFGRWVNGRLEILE